MNASTTIPCPDPPRLRPQWMAPAWQRRGRLGSAGFGAVLAPAVTVNLPHEQGKFLGQRLRQIIARPQCAADMGLDCSVIECLVPGIAIVPHDTLGHM